MTFHRLVLAIALLGSVVLGGFGPKNAMAATNELGRATVAADRQNESPTRLAQAQPAPELPQGAPTPSASSGAASEEPIGNVAAITGTATVIRNKNSIALQLKDDIFLNDTVQTSAGASLGITFDDGTTFHLSANSKVTIDNFVYQEGGGGNAGLFDIGKGTVAFVAASLAKTGDMQITTPTATLGIRGTTGLIEVPEGAAAATANNVNIKLYPDADGRVGRIEVNDRQGGRLGALTQAASGFAIRPGTGGARVAAVPLAISPQQAARDQGFVRQVHTAQTVGRQIVTEQRAIRRANPPGQQQPRQPGQPQRQPGQQQPQRQPGQQQQPGQRPGQQQPGSPNRRGQPQPGAPNRQGLRQSPPAARPTAAPPAQAPRMGQAPVHRQPGALPHLPGALQHAAPGNVRQLLQRPGRPPASSKEKNKGH